jgi:hypothetical protein
MIHTVECLICKKSVLVSSDQRHVLDGWTFNLEKLQWGGAYCPGCSERQRKNREVSSNGKQRNEPA